MVDGGAESVPGPATPAGPFRSRRLLALAGDARLVEQVRRGNEAAFEVVFERHGAAILGFCRHMLGSLDEAEDVVQHTFAAAYRDLQRDADREIALKSWLFAIARNRCMSLLRARRDQAVGEPDTVSTVELGEQVEQRAELRRLVADLGELPDEQRAALLLTELGDLSHADVAATLGCEVPRVKALVFRARSQLIARREARDTPCELIREQLANLRGGALRRTELRLHVRDCPGCRAYRDQVRQQRRMLAAALPVAPTLGLKSSVLAAIGLSGGSAGGAAGAAGAFGGATVAKIAIAGALAGGGIVGGEALVESEQPPVRPPAPAQVAPATSAGGGGEEATSPPPVEGGPARPHIQDAERVTGSPPHRTKARPDRGGAVSTKTERANRARGPIDAPPADTPVKRGPPKRTLAPQAHPPGQAKVKHKPAPATKAKPKSPHPPTGNAKPKSSPPGARGAPGQAKALPRRSPPAKAKAAPEPPARSPATPRSHDAKP